MTNIALITALLSTFASLSSCAFHTLSVCCGDNATLQCANLTRFPSHVFWFKLNNEHNASSIASMRSADTHATLFDGFQSGKFNMSSDSVTLNLTIKHVNSSDSGLYFCGFKSQNNAVIQSATSLIVEVTSLVEEPQAGAPVMHLIGGALITVLVGAIALLAVKIRRLQKDIAAKTNEDLGSDVQNYASLDFQVAQRRRRTPPENRSDVVYATTR